MDATCKTSKIHYECRAAALGHFPPPLSLLLGNFSAVLFWTVLSTEAIAGERLSGVPFLVPLTEKRIQNLRVG